jgi:hypothetical protein
MRSALPIQEAASSKDDAAKQATVLQAFPIRTEATHR